MSKKYTFYKNQNGGLFEIEKLKLKNICSSYRDIPTVLPKVPRIIALGDIHGDYNLAIQLLKLASLIKIKDNKIIWIGGSTIVVQVGDQIDSYRPSKDENKNLDISDEPNDIKILYLFSDLDKQAAKYNGMVISLLGNHEIMNSEGFINYVSKNNLKDIGGAEERKRKFAPGGELGIFLGCTRHSSIIIGSNLFVHAGFIDGLIKEMQINTITDIEEINLKIKMWLTGLIDKKYISQIIDSSRNTNSIFWTRVLGSLKPGIPLSNTECSNNISQVLKIFQIDKIIVGHTPTSFLWGKGCNATCDDHVIRIDNGSSKAFDKFDTEFKKTGLKNKNRQPQVLEILNDTEFKILS
jgi:hypothetical protein